MVKGMWRGVATVRVVVLQQEEEEDKGGGGGGGGGCGWHPGGGEGGQQQQQRQRGCLSRVRVRQPHSQTDYPSALVLTAMKHLIYYMRLPGLACPTAPPDLFWASVARRGANSDHLYQPSTALPREPDTPADKKCNCSKVSRSLRTPRTIHPWPGFGKDRDKQRERERERERESQMRRRRKASCLSGEYRW